MKAEEKLNDIQEQYQIGKIDIATAINKSYLVGTEQAAKLRKENERLREIGKEATSLIAHLKDQYGFNDVEEESQSKINKIFGYEGDW